MTTERQRLDGICVEFTFLPERREVPKLFGDGTFPCNRMHAVVVVRFGGPEAEGLAYRAKEVKDG